MENTLLSVMTLVIASLATVHETFLPVAKITDKLLIAPLMHEGKKRRKNDKSVLPLRIPTSVYVLILCLKSKLKAMLKHIKDNGGEIEVSNSKPSLTTTATQAQGDKIDTSLIPDRAVKSLAQTFLPDIIAFYETDEGKAEFEKWKRETGIKT